MACKIIGSGVQGLSTGIILQHLGCDTTILTKNIAYIDGLDIPDVATDYAAASIYPVKIESQYTEDELINFAERTFKPFFDESTIPVRKQTHYYLYEDDRDITLPDRMNITPVREYDSRVPSRETHTVNSGYVCEEYFVEMPKYIPLLHTMYRDMGGEILEQTVTKQDVETMNATHTVFNCAGNGSKELFGDESMCPVKGHIVGTPYDGDTPLSFGYTYTPEGTDEYTYMYPRENSVIFGGTYLEGEFRDGEWVGEQPVNKTTRDGVEIPVRIPDVNSDIMRAVADVSVDELWVKYGYRPYRKDGMRIEKDADGIVHNYGHGGAGVSMSWWSAVQAVNTVTDVSEDVVCDIAQKMGGVSTPTAKYH